MSSPSERSTGDPAPDTDGKIPRRRQNRTVVRVERIIAEALAEFANDGYASASTRKIAQRAGLAHQLLLYHFNTKDNLWRQVILEVARRYREWFDAQLASVAGLSPHLTLRTIQSEFVRFSARNPELYSIMMHGTGHSQDRLDWLVSQLVTPILDIIVPLVEAAQATGHYVAGDPIHLQYAFMGAITRVFMLAPEVQAMIGRSPLTSEFIERHVELCLSLFFRDPD